MNVVIRRNNREIVMLKAEY